MSDGVAGAPERERTEPGAPYVVERAERAHRRERAGEQLAQGSRSVVVAEASGEGSLEVRTGRGRGEQALRRRDCFQQREPLPARLDLEDDVVGVARAQRRDLGERPHARESRESGAPGGEGHS
ncbi:hypothetical protein [Nannocystis pusilla]|uniref:hypothetical protein n=1 Tax=Nannocystis pusilla TaxID=889268 RepID=UPI003B772BD0